MRILHTSDWHVGKLLRGESRLEEHRAVLGEITEIARREAVDLVLVAGDLYESAAPSPDAEALVLRTLLDLAGTGAQLVVIAGNHDHAQRFEAVRPLFAQLGVTVAGHVTRPETGGVVEVRTRGGETAQVALLPFCSQRYAVRADQLMAMDAADTAGLYAERMRRIIGELCRGFGPGTVNLVVAHGMLRGGRTGGGERAAQTYEDYWIDATAFPATAHYVALGHLHATQQLPGGAPLWYCGSPIQVDFGEGGAAKHVLVVDVTATTPAIVTTVLLEQGAQLRTVSGTLEELAALVDDVGDAALRVRVQEAARVGLADEVRALLPGAVEVILEAPEAPGAPARATRRGRSPHELFGAFLDEQGIADDRLTALFARLHDEVEA